MIPRFSACVPTVVALTGFMASLLAVGLAALPSSVRAEPTVADETITTPVVAQTLPRVTVVSERPPRALPIRPTARLRQVEKICGTHEEALRVLRLTAIERGVRVDYQFAVSGSSTWTSMNRPLLKQVGVRTGGTVCLPRDRTGDMHSARASDAERGLP